MQQRRHTARARRRSTQAAVSALAAIGLAAAAAPSAHALDVVTCGGTQTASYSPALSSTPQSVLTTVATSFRPCVNVLRPLELRTGVSSGSIGPSVRTCDSLLASFPGQQVIRWSTGTTSTFTFVSTVNALAGGVVQVVQQGSISAGEFAGDAAIGIVLLAQADLDACATTGVASLDGAVTLSILS